MPRGDHAGLAGFGIRLPVWEETKPDLEMAKPVVTLLHARASSDWRFVFILRRER